MKMFLIEVLWIESLQAKSTSYENHSQTSLKKWFFFFRGLKETMKLLVDTDPAYYVNSFSIINSILYFEFSITLNPHPNQTKFHENFILSWNNNFNRD